MNDTELKKLMEEVRSELAVVLDSEMQKLSKAHPGEETEAESAPDKSSTDSGDGKGAPPPAVDSAPPTDSAPPAPAADASAPPAPDASAPVDPAADAGPMDPAALQAEYAALPIEELKMHCLAAKAALFAAMGASDPAMAAPADAGAPPAAAPSAPPMAPPAPAASPTPPPPAMKSEMPPEMEKSEKDLRIAELEKSVKDLEGVVPGLLKIVEKTLAMPPRKGITSVADLPPGAGSLSKSEIDSRLLRAIKTDLSDDDRGLVNSYSYGHIGVEKIAHLLK